MDDAAPQILIPDETANNLDTESEQLIQAATADLILLMDAGLDHRVQHARRADGRRGAYHAMVKRQMETEGREEGGLWG